MKRYMVADATVIADSDTFTFCEESDETMNMYGIFHNALKGLTVFEDYDGAHTSPGVYPATAGVYTIYGGTWLGEYPGNGYPRTEWLAPGIRL